MGRSTEVVAEGAEAVVVKRATGADVPALRAAGERLRSASHPGVVEVLSSTGSEDAWELRLCHAGRPLDVIGPLTPEQIAGLVAATATTLADLHAVGVVHGAVEASHVLIGPQGRPILCGFAEDAEALEPADDVAALGTLVVQLLGTEGDLEPIPDRRWRRPRSSGLWARRSLLLLADQACAEPATRRPSARRLAAEISEAVPDAALAPSLVESGPAIGPGAVDSDPIDPLDALRVGIHDVPTRAVRLLALACVLAAVIVLAAGGLRLARPRVDTPPVTAASSSVGHAAAPSRPSSPAPTSPAKSLLPTTDAGPPSLCVRPPAVAGAGAGCAAPVAIEGSTLLVGARRYEVGQAGDRVALGDWDCDGFATPALLRPSSGEVFVFATWATDQDVVVRAVDRIPGAVELLVEGDADGCAHLVVGRADGTHQRIATVGAT